MSYQCIKISLPVPSGADKLIFIPSYLFSAMQPNIEFSDWYILSLAIFIDLSQSGSQLIRSVKPHWFLMSSVIYPLRTDIRKPD